MTEEKLPTQPEAKPQATPQPSPPSQPTPQATSTPEPKEPAKVKVATPKLNKQQNLEVYKKLLNVTDLEKLDKRTFAASLNVSRWP